jgi:hypothetical protein
MSRYFYHIYLYVPHHIFLTLKITCPNFYCNIMMFRISHIQKFTIFASNCVIRVYVYFSGDADKYKEQLQSRLSKLSPTVKLFSDADAVVILTALIKHHEISMEDIMALPEVRERKFPPFVIRQFLDHHDLLKKTPTTTP